MGGVGAVLGRPGFSALYGRGLRVRGGHLAGVTLGGGHTRWISVGQTASWFRLPLRTTACTSARVGAAAGDPGELEQSGGNDLPLNA